MLKGKRVKELRKNLGFTQKEFAKKIGKSTQAVYRMERENTRPVKSDTLEMLSESLNTTTDYLLGLSDTPNLELFDIVENDEKGVLIPVFGSVPAGVPVEALQVDYGYISLDKQKLYGDKRFIGLKVKGDSMYPYYMDGDIVVIEITTDVKSGDDVVVYIGNYEATLKRFHFKDDYVELEPLNREYPVKRFGRDDPPVRVLGKVVELRREVWK